VLAVTLGATGVVLNQLFIWPQVWRARRTLEGVSLLTVLSGVLARLAWSVYGWQTGDVALIAGNVTVTVGFLLLVVMLARGEVVSWPRVTIRRPRWWLGCSLPPRRRCSPGWRSFRPA